MSAILHKHNPTLTDRERHPAAPGVFLGSYKY
jgi:hypothetical protein